MMRQRTNPLREWRCTMKFILNKTKIVVAVIVLLYAVLISLTQIRNMQLAHKPLGGELVDKYVKLEVKGWGFNGQPVMLRNLSNYQRALIDRSIQVFHLNAWLSERISLRRTLPDFRDKRCSKATDNEKLPKASIIIIYHNDHPTILLRCLYSIFIRTQPENFEEVMLVDVVSDHAKSKGAGISKLLYAHFGQHVRYILFDGTTGEVAARAYGARHARGKVFVFLEASIEVTLGWLVPLLRPIAADERVCTTPTLDEIHYNTFAYRMLPSERGGFNWKLNHKYLPLLPKQMAQFPAAYENPVMNGAIFAISARWYWQLSPYDVGLSRWGGENYELSFMMWMCGGRVLELPCSRVGYVHKDTTLHISNINETYKNYKRIVEVWLDEYKDTVYQYRKVLLKVDAGDLRPQHNFRKKMQCKRFNWYLTHVMPDFLWAFPPKMPYKYANGIVKFMGKAEYCLIMAPNNHDPKENQQEETIVMLDFCPKVSKKVPFRYDWTLGFYFNIRQGSQCLEIGENKTLPTPALVGPCHQKGGNQFWYYDYQSLTIQHGDMESPKLCLEGDGEFLNVFVDKCDFGSPNQRWRFNNYNSSALDRYAEALKNAEKDVSLANNK